MKSEFVKHMLVFLFLFTIVERTGVSVISFIVSQSGSKNIVMLLNQPESSTQESENKEKTLKEFWVCDFQLIADSLILEAGQQKKRVTSNLDYSLHKPSVPSPPPDKRS
ncbi:hypothetical protein [Desertivirga xinjiangensis]|uniref:hypothetical protein n=1 Tax=Desertivirga xinjiangensis TaxID=539206 RepID=UPI00210EFBF9|nr:hypothetical protein [Pedobacter xinjiangensis]